MAQRPLLSVAPMMDWTDLYYRQMARLLSKRTWLWTEMVVDKTILNCANVNKHLWFPPEQHPIVCQLGGSDPATLAAAAQKVAEFGYDEINLNCGCPSDRVAGAGCFGASLMFQPELVAACMKAIGDACEGTRISVKCRLGVDDLDSYEQLCHFITTVASGSPVIHFVIHARKCFLQGLNPSQNRTVPPLRHEWVYALRRDFSHLQFSLNGGVQNCYEARTVVEYAGPWPSLGYKEGQVHADDVQEGNDGCQRNLAPATAPASASVSAPECMEGQTRTESLGQETGVSSKHEAVSPSRCAECEALSGSEATNSRAASGDEAGPLMSTLATEATESSAATKATEATEATAAARAATTATAAATAVVDSSAPASSAAAAAAVPLGSPAAAAVTAVSGGMLEGVMIGRAAYHDPWGCLADTDRALYGDSNPATSRRQVMRDYAAFADPMIGHWGVHDDGWKEPNVRLLVKPLLSLFHGEKGSKKWKTTVDSILKDPGLSSVTELLDRTLHLIPDSVLDAPPRSQPLVPLGALPPPTCCCLGSLPTAESRAGGNMSMQELRKALEVQNASLQGKSTRADRMSAKQATAATAGATGIADTNTADIAGIAGIAGTATPDISSIAGVAGSSTDAAQIAVISGSSAGATGIAGTSTDTVGDADAATSSVVGGRGGDQDLIGGGGGGGSGNQETSHVVITQEPDGGQAALAVFARLPVAGRVKTRLAATLASGHEGACKFYSACACRIISGVSSFQGASTSVFHSSADETEDVQNWLQGVGMGSLEVVPQCTSPDLGVIMYSALDALLQRSDVDKALVVGTDIPDLSAAVIAAAVEALEQYQLVLGPAVDGGYYLVGCKGAVPMGLFQGIEWSTSTVLADTLLRAAALGLSVAPTDTLPTLQDIDTAEDLRNWLQDCKSATSTFHTLAASLVE